MRTEKLITLFKFAAKSKVKAGEGLDEGNFDFYTSSSVLKKRINKAQYFEEALIFGTGGSASVHFAGEPFATSTDCIVAISKQKDLNAKFVYYYLLGNIHLLEQGFKGAGLKHISKKYVENLDIPILPIETQNKIVAILDKAIALVRKREQVIQLLDELLRATFSNMFGDPFINDKKWDIVKFKEIINGTPRNGISPSSKGIIENKVLMLSAITRGFFDKEKVKVGLFEKDFNADKLVSTVDFLVCRGNGNLEMVGIGEFPIHDIPDTAFPDTIIASKINIEKINKWFLSQLWKTRFIRHQIEKGARTTNGTFKINQGLLENISLILPPIELQSIFSDTYSKTISHKIKLQHDLVEMDNLIKSIIQKAFNGQLNFNIDFELDALIYEVDIQKKDNDLSMIEGDIAYLQRLVDKLNAQEFRVRELYDKAKHAAFQLMTAKEENRKVTQAYNDKTKSLELALK